MKKSIFSGASFFYAPDDMGWGGGVIHLVFLCVNIFETMTAWIGPETIPDTSHRGHEEKMGLLEKERQNA